jgi:hypothetical protein
MYTKQPSVVKWFQCYFRFSLSMACKCMLCIIYVASKEFSHRYQTICLCYIAGVSNESHVLNLQVFIDRLKLIICNINIYLYHKLFINTKYCDWKIKVSSNHILRVITKIYITTVTYTQCMSYVLNYLHQFYHTLFMKSTISWFICTGISNIY